MKVEEHETNPVSLVTEEVEVLEKCSNFTRFNQFVPPNPRKYVIWLRIDQKTCLKAVMTAGFIPVIIDNVVEEDQVKCNLENTGVCA